MKFIVSNVIEVQDPNYQVLQYIESLEVINPTYEIALRLGRNTRWTSKELLLYTYNAGTYILPYGCIKQLYAITGDKTLFVNKLSTFKENTLKRKENAIKLYDYQEIAVDKMYKAKNGVLVSPCGSGKTNMALELVYRNKAKCLWITHTKDLLNQSYERAKSLFYGEFGMITEGEVRIGKDITFATVQTLSKIEPELYRNEFSMVVIDECQHLAGSPTNMSMFYKVVNNINCSLKIGVSATPKRADSLIPSLYALIGDIVYEITKEQVANNVMKATYECRDINIHYDYENYINADGTINFTELINTLANNKERNDLIIKDVKELTKTRKQILILCNRVSQCEYLAEQLKGSLCVGKVKDRDFNSQIIVATFQLAKEGLDIQTLDTLILTSPVKDEVALIQARGRVERKCENKLSPIIIDYVDTTISYCLKAQKKRKNILLKK